MLVKKLAIKPGFKCLVIRAPEEFEGSLGELPAGVSVCRSWSGPGIVFDYVHLFAANSADIDTLGPDLFKAVRPDGVLWVSYPKKGGGLDSDLSREACCAAMQKYGLQPVSQVAIDETWSALRFKPSGQVVQEPAPEVPEIDYQNRRVFLPPDFKAALEKEGLLEKFTRLSFTHQKEHVLAIVTSKKPETRQSRIQRYLSLLEAP